MDRYRRWNGTRGVSVGGGVMPRYVLRPVLPCAVNRVRVLMHLHGRLTEGLGQPLHFISSTKIFLVGVSFCKSANN